MASMTPSLLIPIELSPKIFLKKDTISLAKTIPVVNVVNVAKMIATLLMLKCALCLVYLIFFSRFSVSFGISVHTEKIE